MRICATTLVIVGFVTALISSAAAPANARGESAFLSGYNTVPPISTAGSGSFHAQIDEIESQITYSLSYKDLEGQVLQGELHFGHPTTNGAIIAYLCSNYVNRAQDMPLDVPPCAGPDGTVEGVLETLDILGAQGQGIKAGAFNELVAAIEAGLIYVTVGTGLYPAGEIRGQINY